jgi:hypothetical protein
MSARLEHGFLLDRQWHWLRGEMETSKRPTLLTLAQLLDEASVAYVVIGGVALQALQDEPRTTLDIDVAVLSRNTLPRDRLLALGFTMTGTFEHSENWRSLDGTPVQFTDDPQFAAAIETPDRVALDAFSLPVMSADQLLQAKLRAAADPARRRSKRLQDLADAVWLLERDPSLASGLTPAERGQLQQLPD